MGSLLFYLQFKAQKCNMREEIAFNVNLLKVCIV